MTTTTTGARKNLNNWPVEFSPCSEEDMAIALHERKALKQVLETIAAFGLEGGLSSRIAASALKENNHQCLFERKP